jgi:hypothetical protein
MFSVPDRQGTEPTRSSESGCRPSHWVLKPEVRHLKQRPGFSWRQSSDYRKMTLVSSRIPTLEVSGVRFNILLLPIQVGLKLHMDAHWRPLRPFRFSVRVMMLVVALTGAFCGLWVWFQAYQMRLARAINYHGDQAFDPFLPGADNRPWHARMYNEYHAAFLRNDMIATTFMVVLTLIILAAIVGRVMNGLCRRSHVPHQE